MDVTVFNWSSDRPSGLRPGAALDKLTPTYLGRGDGPADKSGPGVEIDELTN